MSADDTPGSALLHGAALEIVRLNARCVQLESALELFLAATMVRPNAEQLDDIAIARATARNVLRQGKS